MKEFIQEFKMVARKSSYKKRALVEEFKRGTNRVIRRKLINVTRLLTSIEQWYKCATNLNKYWRKSRRDKERLRGRKESRNQRQRQMSIGNNLRGFRL